MFRELREEDPDKAIERYREYMQKREDELLEPGTGLPLVKALLQLNEHAPDGEPPITEVVILSQNSSETGARVLNSIRERDLDISRSASPSVMSRDSPAELRVINRNLWRDRSEWSKGLDEPGFGGVTGLPARHRGDEANRKYADGV